MYGGNALKQIFSCAEKMKGGPTAPNQVGVFLTLTLILLYKGGIYGTQETQ